MKNYVILALTALVIAISFKACRDQKALDNGSKSIVQGNQDTGKRWTDQAGRQHLTKQAETADADLLYLAHTREIDSFTRLLKIERDQVKAYAAIATRATGTMIFRVDTVYVGDTTSYHLRYADKWISANGEIGLKNYLDYEIRDSIVGGVFFKKTGLLGLGRGKYLVDAYSMNPKVAITGLTTLVSSVQPPSRFGVGPYVGVCYYQGRLQPAAGFSLHYSLYRF